MQFLLTRLYFYCKIFLLVKYFHFTRQQTGGHFMEKQTYHMTMLYDFYGDLLTNRQKDFYDMHYNEDLSLTEIADEYNITRQGVRDVIVRAQASLEEIEHKTGLIERYHSMQQGIESIEETLSKIESHNHQNLQDPQLSVLCTQLNSAILSLRRE